MLLKMQAFYSNVIRAIHHADVNAFKEHMQLFLSCYSDTLDCATVLHTRFHQVLYAICEFDAGDCVEWLLCATKGYYILYRSIVSERITRVSETMLQLAVYRNSYNVVRRLLPFTGTRDTLGEETPLLAHAIIHRNAKIGRLLIDHGARVENSTIHIVKPHITLDMLTEYQADRDTKRAACTAAVTAVMCAVRRRRGVPRDIIRHLARYYVWPLRTSDAWLPTDIVKNE